MFPMVTVEETFSEVPSSARTKELACHHRGLLPLAYSIVVQL